MIDLMRWYSNLDCTNTSQMLAKLTPSRKNADELFGEKKIYLSQKSFNAIRYY